MSADFTKLTIASARALLDKGELSAVELAEHYLSAIEQKNPRLNALLEVYDDVLAQAAKADERPAIGTTGALLGVPLAIKDNILIKGRTVSAASRMLENYQAVYDATVITKLKDAGAVFLGRTNMDEFAMGGSTENSAYGPTKNPHDETRVPGGTSGGSAAAVGGGLALAALGSDTGGSIRQPASFCGVVGLKPTYGTVSRYGLIAMTSSFDQIGPLAKTVADAEIIYRAIAGRDARDATSTDPRPAAPAEKFIIGVPDDFLAAGVDKEVMAIFNATLKKLATAGHSVRPVELPHLKYSLSSYYVVMFAESSTNLGRFDGLRYGTPAAGNSLLEEYENTRGAGFGLEVRRRIILGTYVLSAGYYDAYYGKATAVRELVRNDYLAAFDQKNGGVDMILTPTAPTPAWSLGAKTTDPLQMYLEDVFTVPASLAGIPALSVPAGQTAAGLPVGIQLAGPHFGEDNLFALGRIIESFA